MAIVLSQWLQHHHLSLTALPQTPQMYPAIAYRLVQEAQHFEELPFLLCPLADAWEHDLETMVASLPPLIALSQHLLDALHRRRPLTRAQGTWLGIQVAYLRAWAQVLDQEKERHRPWLERGKIPFYELTEQNVAPFRLQALLKSLRSLQLTDLKAEESLQLNGRSSLLQKINESAIAWFLLQGTEEQEAHLLVERVGAGLRGHLLAVVVEHRLPLAQLQKFVQVTQRRGGDTFPHSDREFHLDLLREQYRAQLLQDRSEPLWGAIFAWSSLYVSRLGLPEGHGEKAEDLSAWCTQQLDHPQQITVLVGAEGMGKSMFCRAWAIQLAEQVYPQWFPLVLDAASLTLGSQLETTLNQCLPQGRFFDRDGWFSLDAPPCVIILDNVDRLPGGMPAQEQLWRQILRCQQEQLTSEGWPRHRFVLTVDSDRWSNVERLIRGHQSQGLAIAQCCPIYLQPFSQGELSQWFQCWSQLQNKTIAQGYFSLLKQRGIFHHLPQVQTISKFWLRPLVLYAMALLHRDGWLDPQWFSLSLEPLQDRLFRQLNHWLLREAPPGGYVPEFRRGGLAHATWGQEEVFYLLAGRSPQIAQQSFQTLALRLWQGETLAPPEEPLPSVYFQTLPPWSGQGDRLAWRHSLLVQGLITQALAYRLITFAQAEEPSVQVADLYGWFGHQVLSTAWESSVFSDLQTYGSRHPQDFSWERLQEHLTALFTDYCGDRWLDQGIPLSWHQSHPHWGSSRTIEGIFGLNLYILIARLGRHTQTPFLPCGQPSDPTTYAPHHLALFFAKTAGQNPLWHLGQRRSCWRGVPLVGAILRHQSLPGSQWSHCDLSLAQLQGTIFHDCDMLQSNLAWSHCAQTSFLRANLQGADLRGADLRGADLREANLEEVQWEGACIEGSRLDPVQRDRAIAQGAHPTWGGFLSYHQHLQEQWQQKHQEELPSFSHLINTIEGELSIIDLWQGESTMVPATVSTDEGPTRGEAPPASLTLEEAGTPQTEEEEDDTPTLIAAENFPQVTDSPDHS